MKKNYINPELTVVYVNTVDCITVSVVGIGENENDNLVDIGSWFI